MCEDHEIWNDTEVIVDESPRIGHIPFGKLDVEIWALPSHIKFYGDNLIDVEKRWKT